MTDRSEPALGAGQKLAAATAGDAVAPTGMRLSTKLIWGVVVAAVAITAAAIMAFALWGARAPLAAGTVTAGDLQLHYEEGSWKQVTPGVTSPAQGSFAEGTQDFVSMPGDVIELTVPVTTLVQGENLNGTFRVTIDEHAEESEFDGPIEATFRVENQDGEQVGPATGEAQMGEPVEVAGLEGSNEGTAGMWRVIVTVRVLGEYRWSTESPMNDLADWAVEDLTISLEQTRSGEGFREEENSL